MFDYVELKVEKCNPQYDEGCPTGTNYTEYLQSVELNLLMTNHYADMLSYKEEGIHTKFLEDTFYWPLLPHHKKVSNIYVKKNYVSTNDDIW